MMQRYSKLLHVPNKLESKLLYFTFFKNNPANLLGSLDYYRLFYYERKDRHNNQASG